MKQLGIFKLIGTIIGILLGVVTLWGKYVNLGPSFNFKVIEIKPIAVTDKDIYLGVSAVVHIKNGPRPISISGLELSGISVSEQSHIETFKNIDPAQKRYYAQVLKGSKKHVEIEELENASKVEFSAWPKGGNTIRMEPYDEQYMAFTFIEPNEESVFTKPPILVGKKIPDNSERDNTKVPLMLFTLRHGDQLKLRTEIDVTEDIKQCRILFYLKVNSTSVGVYPDKIREIKIIPKQCWDKDSAQELFYKNY